MDDIGDGFELIYWAMALRLRVDVHLCSFFETNEFLRGNFEMFHFEERYGRTFRLASSDSLWRLIVGHIIT